MCNLTLPSNTVNNGFLSSLTSNLWLLREENLYTDLEIECDDNKIISVHKIILAASVEYFRQMFNSNMIESVTNKIKLNVRISLISLNIVYF